VGTACIAHGEMRNMCKVMVEKPEGKRPRIGERIILKWILLK
jgi:hypothetical protein